MRDIKFRAWCETEKHMYNWNNLLNQNLKNIFTIYPINKKRLEENGYSVYEPNLFRNYYVIRWVE